MGNTELSQLTGFLPAGLARTFNKLKFVGDLQERDWGAVSGDIIEDFSRFVSECLEGNTLWETLA